MAATVQHVAGDLGARSVAEGSLHRSGDRVRIAAQLIDGVTVWAERYDRTLDAAVAVLGERILLVPDTDTSRAYLCSALGNLGCLDEARQVWGEVVAINPDYRFDDRIASLPFRNPADIARIAKGLERAGLPVPGCRARHSDA